LKLEKFRLGKNGWLSFLALLVMNICLFGCAPVIIVQDAKFESLASGKSQKLEAFQQDVSIRLASGYSRNIAAHSRWILVGEIPQGRVFKPVGIVFTIEGRQVHEAYLVVQGDLLVGFYLPGEGHFSPLDQPVSLSLENLS
jgi:hypothetical protein